MHNLEYYTNHLHYPLELVNLVISKINNLAKPLGSLGKLEDIALHLALLFAKDEFTSFTSKSNLDFNLKTSQDIQKSYLDKLSKEFAPKLEKIIQSIELKPKVLLFCGDHGININQQISTVPSNLTTALMNNVLLGGAGVNAFCKIQNIPIEIIDAGVLDKNFVGEVTNYSLGNGTKDFSITDALSKQELQLAFKYGEDAVHKLQSMGFNTLILGEIGIGNTASASAMLSKLLNISAENSVGRGSGIDDKTLLLKTNLIAKALARTNNNLSPMEILKSYGGFEIAQITSAIIAASKANMCIIIDGFMVTVAALIAYYLDNNIIDNLFFSHQSNEKAHIELLKALKAETLLNLDLRLGEGTGAILAYPLIKSSLSFLQNMSEFKNGTLAQRTN